jgi:hypothetical protein
VAYLRFCRQHVYPFEEPLTPARKTLHQAAAVFAAALITLPCLAQEQPPTKEAPGPQSGQGQGQTQSEARPITTTIPAGARLALVLTHPVRSRNIHRGDDVYAQITSPVTFSSEVVIPPGTFVQGKVDKLERKGGRGELHLQSLLITFPNGYVAPVSGPATMESDDGYALKDPGQGRMISTLVLPMAGAGLGALIGHAAANAQPSTITNSLPLGCTGPPPGCLTSSLTVPGSTGESTVIGAAIGSGVGLIASLALFFSSHNFFLDVGSPVEMTLQRPVSLPPDKVADAVRQSAEHPVAPQPIGSRPQLPRPRRGTDICYTPGTPGTPPTIIPGTPPTGISPGTPDIVIPGTPASPGTPYPCP